METLETKEQFLDCDGCAKQEPSIIRKQSEDWRNTFLDRDGRANLLPN